MKEDFKKHPDYNKALQEAILGNLTQSAEDILSKHSYLIDYQGSSQKTEKIVR